MEATTLKSICAELKIEPRVAREKLRAAFASRKSTRTWQKRTNHVSGGSGRTKGSPAEKEARAALSA